MAKTLPQTNTLFQNIALTFSGGGYRAASFGLGILSYFNQVQYDTKTLLDKVSALSTVSGGTICGATYASYLSKGKNFNEFYTDFYKCMDEDQLLEKALQHFSDKKRWKNTHKKRTLINSFALAYSDLLTNGSIKDLKTKQTHLKDICFNATEFSNGLAFRFQTSGDFGNYRLKDKNLNSLSDKMKIADAIASSSCFPLGFAPLIMPDDFISNQNTKAYKDLKKDERFKNGVGIMDGGIVDNQGIGSIMNTDKRRKNKFDLIMVCDVGSYMMDPWTPSNIDVNKRLKIVVSFLFPLPIGLALLAYAFFMKPISWIFITAGAITMIGLLTITIYFLINYPGKTILKIAKYLGNKIPGFLKEKIKYFKKLQLQLLLRMMIERGTSGKKLISEIFLKQIRRLNYDLFYKDESLINRRSTALIYELTEDQFKHGKSDEKVNDAERGQIKNPSKDIFNSAQIATAMGTTLWFTQEDRDLKRLMNLVSCGQFTACYNLLKFCIDLKNSEDYEDPKQLDNMIKIFQKDWEKFRKNPYWLHDAYI